MTSTLNVSLEALLGKEKKTNVSFGTTKARPLFPTDTPPSRVAANLPGIIGAPHRGPGVYNNSEFTTLVYEKEKQITSKKGYSVGARTAKRFAKEFGEKTPCPTTYQSEKTVNPKNIEEPSYKPFLAGAIRFPELKIDTKFTPGPGVYDHNVPMNRKVGYHETFGGKRLLKVPPDNTVLMPENCKGTTSKSRHMSYKDLRKFKIREAYLSLYY